MVKNWILAAIAAFALPAFAGDVPDSVKPKLGPITNALVVTCGHQLAFVAVVFGDGTLTIYDKQSGVPAETALYTASQAASVKGYEACGDAETAPGTPRKVPKKTTEL